MKLLKKVNAIVLYLIVLLAFGCDGNEPVPLNPAPNTSPNTNASKCVVAEWKAYDDPSVYTVAYEYDAQKKLIKDKRYTNGSLRSETFYEYNPAGQITKVEGRDGNFVVEYFTFEYNAAGKLVKRSNYNRFSNTSPLVLAGWYAYEYNAAGKLIKWSDFASANPNTPMAFRDYTYPAANKIAEVGYRVMSGVPTWSDSTEWVLDGQKRPLIRAGVLDKKELLTEQNILSEERVYNNGQGTATKTDTYTYQYNTNGFATQTMRSANGGAPVLSDSYAYNCQ